MALASSPHSLNTVCTEYSVGTRVGEGVMSVTDNRTHRWCCTQATAYRKYRVGLLSPTTWSRVDLSGTGLGGTGLRVGSLKVIRHLKVIRYSEMRRGYLQDFSPISVGGRNRSSISTAAQSHSIFDQKPHRVGPVYTELSCECARSFSRT